MKKIIMICASIILVLVVSSAQADMVEPDSFPAGTDISNAFPGVILSSVGAGFDGDYDSSIFAINPSTQPNEPYNASTGSLVFGTNDSMFPHLFGGYGGAQLRIDFSSNATLVCLDGIGNNGSDYARLEAFDASNNLIDSYTTAQLTTSAFETMMVSGSSISYVLASGVSGDSVGFDNLYFVPVPVPGAVLLGILGLSAAGIKLRKFA